METVALNVFHTLVDEQVKVANFCVIILKKYET